MATRQWEQLAIPQGFPTGSLFGRAGRNIREVLAHSGAKNIAINTEARTIDIWGPTAANVAAAVAVYRCVFANAARVAAYNGVSPGEATTLLGSALESGVCFSRVPPGDEAPAATDKRKQLYALVPAPPTARLVRLAAEKRPTAIDADMSLRPFVLEATAEGVVVARLARAVHAAMAADPPYQAIKLRSSLGKQLFSSSASGARGRLSSPAHLGSLSLADLQELSLGCARDLQGVFSNGVPLAKVSPMVAHLKELGFEPAATKRTVSVHLYERLGFVGHAVVFRRTEGGGLEPQEVRHGKTKLFFASWVAGDARPDFRLKLTGTRQHSTEDDQAGSKEEREISRHLMKVAATCRLEGCSIVISPQHQSTFYVDRVRFIDKEVYRGSLQVDGTTVEVAVKVQSVRDEEGQFHMEAGATCPQLTDQLKRRLASGGAGSGSTAGAEACSSADAPLDVPLYIRALLKISRQLLAVC